MKINKNKWNFIIDVVMFVNMMIVAGIGFMIKFVLVPGFKRNEIYGRGVELYYLGLDRHAWGTVHLIFSLFLLFLLLLHVILHWKLIVCLFKNNVCKRTHRIVLTTSFIVLSLLFGVMPLFVIPELQNGEPHHFHQTQNETGKHQKGVASEQYGDDEKSANQTVELLPDKNNSAKHRKYQDIEINGSMTIDQIALKYHISAAEIAAFIHVPNKFVDERLGRLRRKYGFCMNDVRDFIDTKINR
ncbi:DUF4405 domain-containing protein [Marinilabiliaceae bacterium JC017]|nr:DUF4405 domain-containing protein [Marinilabiliaceae bacterium JC017]